MLSFRIVTYALGAALVLSAACQARSEARGRCVTSAARSLTNASGEPPGTLSRAQVAAIGAIEVPGGGLRCTGTVISDRWVITAKHCLFSDEESLVFRTTIGAMPLRIPLLEAVPHPSSDVVLFEIPPSEAVAAGELEPLQLWAEEAVVVGDSLTLSGYGVTEMGAEGTLRFVDEVVVEVGPLAIGVDGGDRHGACHKDSGGPLLGIDDQGVARLVGTLSGGSASCVGRDDYVRLKAIIDWAEQVQSAHADDPCSGLTWEGECLRGRAIWCDEDRAAAADCRDKQVCGWDVEQSGFRCVDDTLDPCRGVGTSGVCDGDQLLTCERGQLVATDCGTCGKRCSWASELATCE